MYWLADRAWEIHLGMVLASFASLRQLCHHDSYRSNRAISGQAHIIPRILAESWK